MTEILAAFLLALAMLTARHRCREGWYAEGVRTSGSSRCRPSPPPMCGEPVPPYQQPCPRDDRSEAMAIYCTGGSHPVIVDSRTVGCSR